MKIYHKFTNRKNYGTRLETSMSLGGKYADILHTHIFIYITYIYIYYIYLSMGSLESDMTEVT